MDFSHRYQQLNARQRDAVDTIEGPVMVIAGPGTGKTELLSMRAANILKKTDTLPQNILCLTFTESGAAAMRDRLTGIIGKEAYQIAIHTFHSFGSEIINTYADYFYQGASFRAADDLTTYEIITDILEKLEYHNPLASKLNGQFTYTREVVSTISDLKRSGLTSDELLHILDSNDELLDYIEPRLSEIFSRRISASTLPELIPLAHDIAASPLPELPAGITPLRTVLALSLAHAVDTATDTDSTKPITAWKNKWMTKNTEGDVVFKARASAAKLRAVSYVYFQYLSRMQELQLYDYDDMILRVVHALEVFDDLRFNLQEQYQYIMVDEFQDTNLAQMRIIASLTNNPAQEDTPNIMVVGDDDQAIYSFQGADISNILSFRDHYPKTQLITLTDNYRSTSSILTAAREVITQGSNRLEKHIDELDKTLTAHTKELTHASVVLHEAPDAQSERTWIASSIKQQLKTGASPSSIAVLARRHHELEALLPIFKEANIPISYERRDNVLESEPVRILILAARIIEYLSENQLDEANSLIPELIAHPAWGFSNDDIWKLSVKAYDNRQRWIDTMQVMPQFVEFSSWLIALARTAKIMSVDSLLDTVIGSVNSLPEDGSVYKSPLYGYFFSETIRDAQPESYLYYLEAIRKIRHAFREHYAQDISLSQFVRFIDLSRELGTSLTTTSQVHTAADEVHLMTAHKSKGLEFDTVYVIGGVDSAWGETVRTRPHLIPYPENLPLRAAGDTPDERLRLFFVAMTRAKQTLHMSYSLMDETGKSLRRAGFLLDTEVKTIDPAEASYIAEPSYSWIKPLSTVTNSLRDLLAPNLESYKLSATHLGNFLDVTRGGPQNFLLQNLLRFPQAITPSAAYGSAVHEALQRAHAHYTATGNQRALEDILHDYEQSLLSYRLNPQDLETYTQKGVDTLQAFLSFAHNSFKRGQKVELSFASQQSLVGDAHLTGKLDLVDINQEDKRIIVTDYKTGHPSASWQGKTDYEKAKLHRYKQQLMFYKLLVEHSRDYHTYTVQKGVLQFVEPTGQGSIVSLEDDFSDAELDTFRKLLEGVWGRIKNLDLPDTSGYEQSYKGILAFEQDIIDNNI